ncbi:MAG: DUF1330 domain-containing protein [Candidatus Hydrogenedentota bacterium]
MENNNENSRREFMGTTGAAAGLAALAVAFTGKTAEGAEAMELNAMQPTPAQIQAFMKLPDRPVVMVNLLKFKDNGEGAEEYAKYGVEVSKILMKIGAEILFSGQCQTTMIGGAEWDAVALVRYPNSKALINMAQSAEYQKIHVHRDAGLEGQVNIAVFETSGIGIDTEVAADAEGEVTADQIMSSMDTNGDGKIDLDEAPDQLKGAFGMVDVNADGGIDLEEAQMIADFANNQ